MDLDGLKEINDLKGYIKEDLHINKFSRIIETVFKKSGYKIRNGGDDFVVVWRIDSSKGGY